MTLGFAYNIFLCFSARLFRTASTGLFLNATKTLAQIVCIWCVALLLIPFVLNRFFRSRFFGRTWTSKLVWRSRICVCKLTGISECLLYGSGTVAGPPLPLDQTNTLVVTGPYRFVRNPMAIAGISQGLAIALIFQSLAVLIYSLLGGLIWHFVVRPIEEADMERRFGESYLEYREAVSCWIPKR